MGTNMEVMERKEILDMSDSLSLETGSNAKAVRESIGAGTEWNGYDVAFVESEGGSYTEVWLATGTTAYTWKTAYRVI